MNSWRSVIVFVLAISMTFDSTHAICALGQFSTLQQLPCTEPAKVPNTDIPCSRFADSWRAVCTSYDMCNVCSCSCDPSHGAYGGCPAIAVTIQEVCTTCPADNRGDGLTCTVCETDSI